MHRISLPTIAILSLLTLVSCSDGEPDDVLARACEVERTTTEDVSLCLPTGWSATTESFGEQGSFVMFITNADENLMQVHVKKDPLQEPVRSTMEFAQRAVEIARTTAPNYSAVRTDPITVDGKETMLHIFDASPDEEDDPIRYYQFVTTYANIAYGFTAVINPEVEDDDVKDALLDVFTEVRFLQDSEAE